MHCRRLLGLAAIAALSGCTLPPDPDPAGLTEQVGEAASGFNDRRHLCFYFATLDCQKVKAVCTSLGYLPVEGLPESCVDAFHAACCGLAGLTLCLNEAGGLD